MKTVRNALFLVGACLSLTNCSGSLNLQYDTRQHIAGGFIVVILALFTLLAVYTNLIRDEISNCETFEKNVQKLQKQRKWVAVDKRAPFSLTKLQFGLWTVIISSSYIYLSFCKGDCAAAAINKTALVLMGIFAGTAVASTIIDKNEMNDNRERHQDTPSHGFFVDILSDDNGISLHRFQNLTWTIIAIMVYLYKVSQITEGCQLPELSDTLLALTGISSATYLIMKTKENDPPAQEVQQANATEMASANPVPKPNAPVAVRQGAVREPVASE